MWSEDTLNFKFDKDGVYMIAATYSSSSMALMDMLLKKGIHPIVCYINYHMDNTNNIESNIREYCAEHQLCLEVCDTQFLPQAGKTTDYEKWARKIRYDFFKEISEKYDLAATFIAHTQDDVLETYLVTKRSGIKNAKYGYNKISTRHGIMIVRPLLSYSKEDLREYCLENNVPFSDDLSESTFNKEKSEIRREIEGMNEIERDALLVEMKKENAEKEGLIEAIDDNAKKLNELNIRSIIALSSDEFAETIVSFLNDKSPVHIRVNEKMLKDIRELCLNKVPNASLHLKGDVYLVKAYDVIYVNPTGNDMPYTYVIEKPCKFECDAFDFDFSNGAEDRNIHEDDYPLTVRSVLPQDVFNYGGYLEPIKRMLLENGIDPKYLSIWPVFLNKDGKIIYVPRFKKGFVEYHTSSLHIHLD
ncbi:MAG: tRNA lysidine(34) synthetase TilS [Bacilli bacterium]|nr:tRNA lysidine(34) synthetase TilS [Bacilli bacterium]